MIHEQLEHIPDIKKYSPKSKVLGYIYFIFSKGEIIYVGQTTSDISLRLYQFKKEKKVQYDEVYFILRHPKDLDEIEKYYIDRFKPCYNIHGKRPD